MSSKMDGRLSIKEPDDSAGEFINTKYEFMKMKRRFSAKR